ncbi:MAG: YCF48-related protein [Saprospiraceae bacterium]|nr:YCF48-related protein [Saprospiraceae bacterium]
MNNPDSILRDSARFLPRVLFCVAILVSYHGEAQSDLKAKLAGQTTLRQIITVVDAHYADLQARGLDRNPGEPKLKHWKRWEWYLSGRLGPNGEFVDIPSRISRALVQRQAMPQPRSTISDWTFVGPSVSTAGNSSGSLNGLGRVDRIAFHPSDPDIIYVGTPAGGLWRTTDGGSNWFPLTDHITSPGISGIVVSHANPDHLYILTGDGDSNVGGGFVAAWGYIRPSIGVLKSTDGGITWQQTGVLSINTYYGYRLVQDPNNANVLFAATSDGLFRTVDAGNSWQMVRGGLHYDFAFRPGSSDTTITSQAGSVFYSVNGGDAWSAASLDSTIDANGRVELAVTPANPDLVYALAGPRIDSTTFNGLFQSTDGGLNFVQRSNSPNILSGASDGNGDNDQANYDLGLCASPVQANTIITAGILLWKSTNGGLLLNNLTTYTQDPGETWYVHPDMHDVAYNPLDNKLYAAGDGGLYVSTDDGENWTDISVGIAVTQCYHMAGTSADINKLLIGSQDNGVKLRESNTPDFPHIAGGDGFDVAFAAGSTSKFYTSINKSVVRFWNDGDNFADISPTGFNWFDPVATHISDPDMVWVGSADTIFRSDDEGSSWDTLSVAGSWALATCPNNANRVYAAGASWFTPDTAGTVSRSDNLGDTWTTISGTTGFPVNFTKVNDIAVHPSNSSIVWIVFGGFDPGVKVFRSLNAGASWTNMSGSIPNVPVNCIAIDDNGDAYIGSDIGVFYRPDSYDDWIPFSNALPVVPVTEVILYNSLLRAATFGRGVWQSSKPSSCSVALSISAALEGDLYFEASGSVVSTSVIFGGVGTDISFKAGDYVRLDPGFHVPAGNQFLAFRGDCTSGGVPDP